MHISRQRVFLSGTTVSFKVFFLSVDTDLQHSDCNSLLRIGWHALSSSSHVVCCSLKRGYKFWKIAQSANLGFKAVRQSIWGG